MTLRNRSHSLVAAALVASAALSLSAAPAAAQGKATDPLAAEIESLRDA